LRLGKGCKTLLSLSLHDMHSTNEVGFGANYAFRC